MFYIVEEANRIEENVEILETMNEDFPSEVFEPEHYEDDEFIREFEDLSEESFIPLSQDPFSSFNEDYVMLIGVKLSGERTFLVRESDLNAVRNYYQCDGEPMDCDCAIEKIASHNNIDSSEIVVMDEASKGYKDRMDSLKKRILKETNPEKKNVLRERLNDLRDEERKRRNGVKLAKKINENLIHINSSNLFGETLSEAEMYIHEALPMSDKNKEKLDKIHDDAKNDPDKAARDLNKFYKQKDPETLISLFPSIKMILRCVLTGATAGAVTAVAGLVGGPTAAMAVAGVAPMVGVLSGINDTITSGKVNAKYIKKYIDIYEDEIEYLENRKKKSDNEDEKKKIDRLIEAYKKSLPKLKNYQKQAAIQSKVAGSYGM